MPFNRILIAVDESAVAAHAVDVGIELTRLLKAEVAFIHVVDTSISRAAPKLEIPTDQLIAREEQEARNLLSRVLALSLPQLRLNDLSHLEGRY